MTGWIPMRWPAGPLELVRRNSPAALREDLLRGWARPEMLDMLAGTPINCLVVGWAAGASGDDEQQKCLEPLIAAARSKGLAVAGQVSASAGEAAYRKAAAAKLDALLTEGPNGGAGVKTAPLAERSRVVWRADCSLLAIQGNSWPGVKEPGGVDEASSGPTRAAWIDSNAWYANLARTMAPDKSIWLLYDPPSRNEIVRPESYALAVADAACAGVRWVSSLDDRTMSGLLKQTPESAVVWRSLVRALHFFEQHAGWSAYRPAGVAGVLSDFSGDNEFLSLEVLNLMARRQLPCRVLEAGQLKEAALDELKAIVCMDQPPPAGEPRAKLLEFVRNGGLLLAGKGWSDGKGGPDGEHPRFSLRSVGKGRLAVSKEDSPDPYLVALDAHMLLSRANDLLRLYNVSSIVTNLTIPPAGSRAILHLLNFSGRPGGHPPVVWLRQPYRKAMVWRMESEEAQQVSLGPEMGGVAVHLPELSAYAALEVET